MAFLRQKMDLCQNLSTGSHTYNIESFEIISSNDENFDKVKAHIDSLSSRKQCSFFKQTAKRISKVLELLFKNLKADYPISKSSINIEFLPANIPVER